MVEETQQGINLTKAALAMRNVLKFGGAFLIIVMVGRILLGAFVTYWKATHPEPPPPPTAGFGPLPHIVFPNQTVKPTSYRLETVGNQLPFIAERANVFLISNSQPSLLAVERAKQKATSLGFVFEPEIINTRTYRWTSTKPLLSTLEMDILSGTFTITTDWASHPELFTQKQTVNAVTLSNRLKSSLKSAGSLSDDFNQGVVATKLLKAIGNQFIEADSLSEAEFLQVDIYRKSVDNKYTTVTTKANQAPIHAIIAPNGTILELSMQAYTVQYDSIHDYYIRTPQQAWQVLAGGEGFVVSKGELDEAIVREVSLSYFEPATEQQFFQPVYVFKGDKGFIGYVEAIAPEFFQQR